MIPNGGFPMKHQKLSTTPEISKRMANRVGLATGGVELEFALEAKRYSLNNSVGVKETSRLISSIKHRQFGIFVTTSFVGDQAYKETIEDQHPIVVISGKDIVDILISAGINSVDILNDWLESNFGLH